MAIRGTGKAGDYWQRVTHYVRSVDERINDGFDRSTYTEGNTYWCWTEDAKDKQQLAYGIFNKFIEIVFHIRGFPGIDSLDRLYDTTAGRYCDIKSVGYDYSAGETVVKGAYIKTLESTI